jgi:hypothetical protein
MNPVKNSFDIIDLLGPDATREDYVRLRDLVQELLDDAGMWEDDEIIAE